MPIEDARAAAGNALCTARLPAELSVSDGFGDRLRVQWPWAIPLPQGVDAANAGPLLCGGTTVFAPLHVFGIKPTDRVGVVGIGGLGHMALKLAHAWGCEVTAFTSTDGKANEAKSFGAHRVVNSRKEGDLRKVAGSLDLLLVTVNVPLAWTAMIGTLRPKGRMHVVGAMLEPIPVGSMDIIMTHRSISGSPNGSPVTMATMLEFAARHDISPQTEHFPMDQVNEALAHLEAGKARYRIVLDE